MHRTIQTALLVVLILLCFANVVVVGFVYARYAKDSDTVRDMQYRVQGLEYKIEQRNRWETHTITQEIVTTPAVPGDSGIFTLHVDARTNQPQRFDLQVGKEVGRPVGAWVSEWKPHSEMLKFDDFHVAPNPETGKIELLVTPRANESISMRFTITVLEQKFVR